MRRLAQDAGADVAIGARDRLSMIYFAQSRGSSALRTVLDTGIRIPVATTAMGRAYIFTVPESEREELLDRIKSRAGNEWPKIKAGIDRAGEAMARYGFTISAGDWIEDVYAVGVGLRMNDGTGPYAFNCGAPAFKFNEDRLKAEVGPRLVAMVKDIEAVLNGTVVPAAKPGRTRKNGSGGGRVAREVEGSRQV